MNPEWWTLVAVCTAMFMLLLDMTLLSFVVAPVSGKLAEHVGVRWFIAGGLALLGAGLPLMGGLVAGIAAWGGIFQPVVRDGFTRDAARAGVRDARRSGNPQRAKLGEQSFVAGLNHLLLLAGLPALLGALASALPIRPADFGAAGH